MPPTHPEHTDQQQKRGTNACPTRRQHRRHIARPRVVVFDEMNEREVDVIITEVIEHMELENVIPFVQNILNNLTYNTVLLTTPNNDFNQFYIMNKDFRHDDHRWELGFEEFKEKMGEIVFHETHAMEFFTVGDIVDGICCTSGCRIYKKP